MKRGTPDLFKKEEKSAASLLLAPKSATTPTSFSSIAHLSGIWLLDTNRACRASLTSATDSRSPLRSCPPKPREKRQSRSSHPWLWSRRTSERNPQTSVHILVVADTYSNSLVTIRTRLPGPIKPPEPYPAQSAPSKPNLT